MSLLCLLIIAFHVVSSIQQISNTTAFNETLKAAVEATAEATTCDDCYNILNIIKPAAELGDAYFAALAVQYCIALEEYSEDVCKGLETLEAPSVAYALRSMKIPSRTAQIFCSSLYGLCDQPAVLNYTVSFPKPKPAHLTRPSASDKESIQVVHISDLHVDHKYTVGASYNCSESTCCHAGEITVGGSDYPAGPYGEYYCDSPPSLERSQFEAIREFVPNRAFTICTGDIVEGAEWETTDQDILSDITDSYDLMATALGTVFPAIGNHDANPVNSFPPAGLRTNYSNTYDYNAHAALWSRWIGASAAEQVANNYGSYTTMYGDRLRIISINTMFWEGVNWWIYNTTMSRDPSSVLAFVVESLQLAEDNNQRAWIIGHIPTGHSDCLYDYSAYFDQIVHRYSDTIAALFWGHTHRDQFQLSYSTYPYPETNSNSTSMSSDKAIAMGYITPSLTPTSGNPNFRVYDIDPVTFAVRDFTMYYAPNFSTTPTAADPKWQVYYAAKSAYSPSLDHNAELSPTIWSDIVDRFETNDTLFQEYYERKQRGWDYVVCEGSCKEEEICGLRSAVSADACISPSRAQRRRKRGLGRRGGIGDGDTAGECTKSLVREVFGRG